MNIYINSGVRKHFYKTPKAEIVQNVINSCGYIKNGNS